MMLAFIRRGMRVTLGNARVIPRGKPDDPGTGLDWTVSGTGLRIVDNLGRRVVAPEAS